MTNFRAQYQDGSSRVVDEEEKKRIEAAPFGHLVTFVKTTEAHMTKDDMERIETILSYLPPSSNVGNCLYAIKQTFKHLDDPRGDNEAIELLGQGYEAALTTVLVLLAHPDVTKDQAAKEIRKFMKFAEDEG